MLGDRPFVVSRPPTGFLGHTPSVEWALLPAVSGILDNGHAMPERPSLQWSTCVRLDHLCLTRQAGLVSFLCECAGEQVSGFCFVLVRSFVLLVSDFCLRCA